MTDLSAAIRESEVLPGLNPLVHNAVLPTLARLAAPNVVALLMAAVVAIAETYYVGQLGVVSLAAMALVFPFGMLTHMMSGGAMGSGVSSSISRALGAGQADKAALLAFHAIVIGLLAGVLYSLVFVLGGPLFYRWLGGSGEVLAAASEFGLVLFSGAMLVWLCHTLASILRGTGNMQFPSAVLLGSGLIQILVGGALGLGVGPVPRLGMPGVAIGNIVAMGVAVLFLLVYLQWGQNRIRISWGLANFSGAMFKDILKVGALACLSPLQTVLAALIFTGLVARLGPEALAGYGIGQRLEFLLIPVAFGVGVAAVPMVGMAIGEGRVARARRVAWSAGGLVAGVLAVIGLLVCVWPQLWSGMFSNDPAVLAYASLFLRIVGPCFAFFGLGLVLYFASVGAGHVLGPVLAGTARLLVVAVGGVLLLSSGHASAESLYLLAALAMLVYGASTVWAVWRTSWDAR